LTSQRVTQAAADLADEAGFDNVTLSAVARIFGVAEPSMYAHVKGVRDLRARIAVLAATEMAERISASVAGRAGQDALVSFANAYRDFARAYPGRYAATRVPLPPAQLAESAGHQRINDMTYALFHSYGLSEPDLTDAVRLLRSTFHGFVSLEAVGEFSHPRDIGASWDRGLQALHSMLVGWPANQAGANGTAIHKEA
jgi:AcrR family transcriptional regulator